MKTIINFICSPALTALLLVLIFGMWVQISNAEEIKAPLEGAGCKDNTKINCGE